MEELNIENKAAEVPKDPETPMLKKVREKSGFMLLLALCFGLLFQYCFHDFYSNFHGIVFPIFVTGAFCLFLTGVYLLKQKWNFKSIPIIAGGILFGISTWRTASVFLHFYNAVGCILLFTICMLQQFYEDKEWGIQKYIKNFFKVWMEMFCSFFLTFAHVKDSVKDGDEGKKNKVKEIVKGCLLAVPILLLVLTLLSQADMIFKQIVDRWIFQWFFPSRFLLHFCYTVFGFFCFYGFLCGICKLNLDTPEKISKQRKPTTAIIVMAAIGISYLLFCGIQIVYLFLGVFKLPEGITYAVYARQGFFQLLAVVFLNVILELICLFCYRESKWLKGLSALICGCTFIMIASSAYRMILYIQQYHLTFLRVLVLWFLAVLIFLMMGITYYIYKRTFRIFQFGFTVIICGYLLFSFARPDALIAAYNVQMNSELDEKDLSYLLSLSADAIPIILTIDESQVIESPDYWYEEEMISHVMTSWKGRYNSDFRCFNLSEYQAFQALTKYDGETKK